MSQSLSESDLLWFGLVFTFSRKVWNYLLIADVYLSSYDVPGTHLNPQYPLHYVSNAHDAKRGRLYQSACCTDEEPKYRKD